MTGSTDQGVQVCQRIPESPDPDSPDVLYVGGDPSAAREAARRLCTAPTPDERVPFVEVTPVPSGRKVIVGGRKIGVCDLPVFSGAVLWIGDLTAWDPAVTGSKAVLALRALQEERDGLAPARDPGRRPCFSVSGWVPAVDEDLWWQDTHGLRFGRRVPAR